VNATKAEYWDSPASWVAKTVGFIKAATTGEQENMAENAKIDLRSPETLGQIQLG